MWVFDAPFTIPKKREKFALKKKRKKEWKEYKIIRKHSLKKIRWKERAKKAEREREKTEYIEPKCVPMII